jgi:hypothetical protein
LQVTGAMGVWVAYGSESQQVTPAPQALPTGAHAHAPAVQMPLQHSLLLVHAACARPQHVLPGPPHASKKAHWGSAGSQVLPRAIRQ